MSSLKVQKGSTNGQTPRKSGTCKTCRECRQRKIKCDGNRPRCSECNTSQRSCIYPQDARREPRPSRARVQNLEATVAVMLQHMKTSGIISPHLQAGDLLPDGSEQQMQQNVTEAEDIEVDPSRMDLSYQENGWEHTTSTAAIASPLQTPGTSLSGFTRRDMSPGNCFSFPAEANDRFTEYPRQVSAGELDDASEKANEVTTERRKENRSTMARQTDASTDPRSSLPMNNNRVELLKSSTPIHQYPRSTSQNDSTANVNASSNGSGMSPCEARVAGAFHEHGCVSSVHGLASIMNPTSRAQYKENMSKIAWTGEGAIAASKARLISNAVLQRQREARLIRQPSSLIDLDGCEPELAWHLLDLHFNRQHYAYMISYRPAIMDSIATGGGPWVNKLLLNAIYYSSTLYSDRPCLKSDPQDPNSKVGETFYRRFRQLLVDEIDKPSIPTVVALLLTSATLVSQGRSSAGWNLSGTAYRMIIDMGCHLMLGPDYSSNMGHGQLLRRDLEHEMRRRLYWGAFVTDATQALYLGRPCMFAATEARVPLHFLDTFEELEEWEPYIDPQSLPENRPPAFLPQPAFALSTFSWLVRLFQISTHITDLYGIQVIKCTSEYLQERKANIERELECWSTSLPHHLRFDGDGPVTPPPHQITPHTTFHALTILLNRAFLEEGHLRRHCDDEGRRRSEEACIRSALSIQKLVCAYRNAFTLRRAPFLLSYAVYSAVIVIIRQERHERGQFMEPISFFWTCLSELQRGCNFGLEKPLNILRDMVQEFQVSIREVGAASAVTNEASQLPSLDETFFSLPIGDTSGILDASVYSEQQHMTPDYYMGAGIDQPDFDFGTSSPGFLLSLNHLESDISEDTLFGLFAPPHLSSK